MFNIFKKRYDKTELLSRSCSEKRLEAIKGRKEALNILRTDTNIDVLVEVASHGRDEDLNYFINATDDVFDPNFLILKSYIKKCSNSSLDKLLKSRYCNQILLSILKRNRIEDFITFASASDNNIRMYIASKIIKSHLMIYINDPSPDVRIVVAKRKDKKTLDVLVYDQDPNIRAAVAQSGINDYLDILVHDSSYNVRVEVAKFGRKKDIPILINDSSFMVKLALTRHIKRMDINLLEKHKNIFNQEEHSNELC